jgi:hypothetical protein
MDEAVLLDDIVRAELNSDYNHTDDREMKTARRKEYRYQAVYDIVHY